MRILYIIEICFIIANALYLGRLMIFPEEIAFRLDIHEYASFMGLSMFIFLGPIFSIIAFEKLGTKFKKND